LLNFRKLNGGVQQFTRAMWALLIESAMREGSESQQLKGVTLLNNAKGMNLGMIVKLWPQMNRASLKMMGDVFKDHIPVRMATYLILNEPIFFDFLWKISSSLMKQKLLFRIFFLFTPPTWDPPYKGRDHTLAMRSLLDPTSTKEGTGTDESYLERLPIELGGKLDVDAWAKSGQGLKP
ncbi:hypothetical protein HDU93_006308, partial [Gonapodya sp. JEL0774]